MHLEHYKGVFHMVVFLIVLAKIHLIDKKLCLLEKRFTAK